MPFERFAEKFERFADKMAKKHEKMQQKAAKKAEKQLPQANDDADAALENDVISIDVLDNDKGGKAKKLFSLDQSDSSNPTALGAWVMLASGARVKIENGEVVYDTNFAFESLAEGEVTTDTFTYAIQMGKGAISTATVTVEITGQNDAPTVSDVSGAAVEDGPSVMVMLAGDDVDSDDDNVSLTYQIVSHPGEGTASISGNMLSFDPGADFQDLAAGQTRDVTITYQAVDAHGAISGSATVTVTVTGINDVAEITGDTGSVTEDDVLTASGTVVVVDADAGQSGTVAQTDVSGLYGTFSIDASGNWTYELDNEHADVQDLDDGEMLMETFSVSSSDGSASADVEITINGADDGSDLIVIEGIDDSVNIIQGDAQMVTINGGETFEGLDHHIIGGDMSGFFASNSLVGDVTTVLNNGTFVGGNDVLDGGNNLGIGVFLTNILVGDSSSVTGDGDSTGGADVITGGDGAMLNTIIGDFDAISTTNGSAVLTGGNDTIISGAGASDNIWGDWEDASGFGTMVGGVDTFIFATGNGMDTINDFEVGKDFVELNGYGFTSFGDLSFTDGATDTTLNLGGGDQILFVGVQSGDFAQTEFVFS